MSGEETETRIIRAFLTLAASRGMAAVTTRDIARAAGVNEVTIFRRFGDKASLALAAVRRFQPVDAIAAHRPVIDTTSPNRCLAGISSCLLMLYQQMVSHPELLQFGLADAAHHPHLLDEIRQVPDAARLMITDALRQAAPRLRPDVDIDVEVLGLLGLLLLLATWHSRRWLNLSDDEVSGMFVARLRPLLRGRPGRGTINRRDP